MAAIALAAVVRKVVDISGNLIVEESSRLYWLAEEIQWLKNQLIHMQAYVAVAEANESTNPQVKNLISQVRDLAHYVEDTLDDYVPKIERYRSGSVIKKAAKILPHGFMCSDFARKIQKIRKRVEAIDADRKTYGIQDIDASGVERRVHDPRIVALHVDEPVVVGFDKDINDLKLKLLGTDEGLLFVSIVGMAGVGKTTLAKKVFKSVKRRFNCSASVTVSQQPKFADIFDSIAKQTGLSEARRKENLEANLSEFLKGKRYVLLLDDIWDVETWNKLVVGIPVVCLRGSRIIITSRDTVVGRYIGHERSLHHLNPFNPLTSWHLFKELITPTLTSDVQELEDSTLGEIGKEIVKQCGGLPLALVVTVGMLRERGASEEVLGWFSYTGTKLDCSGADSFPELETLHVEGLNNLEEVTDGGARGMHKLKEFILKYCDKCLTCPEWLQELRTSQGPED